VHVQVAEEGLAQGVAPPARDVGVGAHTSSPGCARAFGASGAASPSEAEFEARLAEHVRDEVLYRSALARGLDRGDGIIRRSLVQKETYLLEAESEPECSLDEATLRVVGTTRTPSATSTDARIDLEHRFFSVDRRGGARLDGRRGGRSSSGAAGDPFLRGERFDASDLVGARGGLRRGLRGCGGGAASGAVERSDRERAGVSTW
jgi:hypothetical protein